MAKHRIPSLRRNCRGQAFVVIDRKARFLGRFDDPEAQVRYDRLIAEWTGNNRCLPSADPSRITVAEVGKAFLAWADDYYRRPDGRPAKEIFTLRSYVGMLAEWYGRTPAGSFGPNMLRALRQRILDEGKYTRQGVNRAVGRIRAVFKWAVGREMVLPNVLVGLQAVEGLARGRCEARESDPVLPVPHEHIDVIRPHVSRQVWALVQVILHCGCRAGEAVGLRPMDLDVTGKVWAFRPEKHKTAWRGRSRTILFGPRAQRAIEPFLAGRATDRPLFSPSEAEQERLDELHKRRKTPASCGNVPGSNRRRRPTRKPGDAYTVDSLRRAIARGCKAASVPAWHPHQLRHTAATAIEKRFGIEHARAVLGHVSPKMTALYSELDEMKSAQVARKMG